MAKHPGNVRSIGARTFSARVAWRYRRYCRLYSRVLDLALELLLAPVIGNQERQKVIATALLGRVIEASQACAALSRLGLANDSAVSVRVVFEAFCYLLAACRDPQFIDKYWGAEVCRQLTLVRAAKTLPGQTAADLVLLGKREAELQLQKDRLGATPLSLEQVAREVGLNAEYTMVFRLTSPQVHSAYRVLEDFARVSGGKLVELAFGFNAKYVEIHLFTVTEYLLRATEQFCNLCALSQPAAWTQLYRQLRRLEPAWPG